MNMLDQFMASIFGQWTGRLLDDLAIAIWDLSPELFRGLNRPFDFLLVRCPH